jgi:predicted CoA-substrate-specific enzyme activase
LKALGLCIGASTISAAGVCAEGGGFRVLEKIIRPHDGNPRETLLKILGDMELDSYGSVAVTGRKFRSLTSLTSISEPEAVEVALARLYPELPLNAIISAGGENFLVYVLGKDRRISSVQSGNKCASGTGEFFLQQIRRLKISLDEAMLHAGSETPFRVSGRCSVFCKSDCTHATNKGVPRERVVAGLCRMMAGKVMEIVKHLPRRDMMLIGGAARNRVMVECLREEIENIIVPEEADCFEALGCAFWACGHETRQVRIEELFRKEAESFFYLPPLSGFGGSVDFKTAPRHEFAPGDRFILGLDVGSTTTKAVLARTSDDAVLASVYLRTNGDPVGASRRCYAEILRQSGRDDIVVAGVGVTGSGRQIAGLHAMTEGIVNEIIAHAAGAAFFNPDVDTIFEIGGQDAKYTFLTEGVPSDYAMNDACSAGTGSFLEEAARESLGIEMQDIGDIALKGMRPPNFNDQCAAFIGSDIKNAFHEGIERQDVVAGLVYSICMNYLNRVKGNRPVGDTIFMQGGVCYNRAVPMAMASLTGKRIIVPPEPGLIGAFGVALETGKRISAGILRQREFSLRALRDRELGYKEPFVCNGGKEKCDRKCEIARIVIEGKIYPFGGACNKWYNVRIERDIDFGKLNYAARHEQMVFGGSADAGARRPAVGVNKSFFVNSYFPLYREFFSALGCKVVLPSEATREGMDRRGAAFCYPAELAHGFFHELLGRKPDALFLPQVKGVAVRDCEQATSACPVSQAEPYYLQAAFKDNAHYAGLRKSRKVFSPVLDFSRGLQEPEEEFIYVARRLGFTRLKAQRAYQKAVSAQEEFFSETLKLGQDYLASLERDGSGFGIVILGRPYNAFVSEAHMGIPQKFASRGISVIPVDFLPAGDPLAAKDMYWSAGKTMLRGAEFVGRHPRLFACFISNFSCGPDSFIIGFARDRMGGKPMLVLELDSHVADAGLETRIEAFIDIVQNYLRLQDAGSLRKKAAPPPLKTYYDPARDVIMDSRGRPYPLSDPRVHVVFPSMGDLLNQAAAAVFRGMGVRASALPPPDEEVLKLGRGNTSCKECLPLLLTTGSLLKYLQERQTPDELLVYFMTTAGGPCRFGQYSVFIRGLIEKYGIEDTTLMSISSDNSYSGLKEKNAVLRLWTGIVLSDTMQDVRSFLMASAADREAALREFRRQWDRLLETMEKDFGLLMPVLESVAETLGRIELKRALPDTPVVLLTGEIYVRSDGLSRRYIVEELAREGIASKVAGVAEWVYYTDWCYEQALKDGDPDLKKRLALIYRAFFLRKYERKIKDVLRKTGLVHAKPEKVNHMLGRVGHIISPELRGEAILTVGAGITEVLDPFCGVVSIGPFGCMPNRISEAILAREMNREGKLASGTARRDMRPLLDRFEDLPFLCIESDGNPFPQIITARLEAFTLQAWRFHRAMSGG